MLRVLMLFVTVLTLLGGMFVFSAPVNRAQAQDCSSLTLASGSFDGTQPFQYIGFDVAVLGPDYSITFSVSSTTSLAIAQFIWLADYPTVTAGDIHQYIQPTGFNDYSFTFDLDSPSGVVPLGALTTEKPITVALAAIGVTLPPNGTWSITANNCPPSYGQPAYVDGRLCIWDDYAIYTDGDSIDVYGIEGSGGYLVASVDQADLDAHPGAAGTNTLISQQENIMFYRLGDSNTYEVHVGPYVRGADKFARFTGLPAEDVYCGVVR